MVVLELHQEAWRRSLLPSNISAPPPSDQCIDTKQCTCIYCKPTYSAYRPRKTHLRCLLLNWIMQTNRLTDSHLPDAELFTKSKFKVAQSTTIPTLTDDTAILNDPTLKALNMDPAEAEERDCQGVRLSISTDYGATLARRENLPTQALIVACARVYNSRGYTAGINPPKMGPEGRADEWFDEEDLMVVITVKFDAGADTVNVVKMRHWKHVVGLLRICAKRLCGESGELLGDEEGEHLEISVEEFDGPVEAVEISGSRELDLVYGDYLIVEGK